MELIIDSASYSSNEYESKLMDVSYHFSSGITFVNGVNIKVIKELLFQKRKLDKGRIYLSERGFVYDVAYLSDVDASYFHEKNINDEMQYFVKYYNLKYKNISKRVVDSLKMVNISSEYLNIPFDNMSSIMLKKMELALALFLNSKIFIFDNFEKEMSFSEVEYFKKLINKLSNSYNKTMIVCSNDINTFLNIISDIVIFKNGKLVYNGNKNSFYDSLLYKYIDQPDIVHYINYLKKKGHIFDSYIDMKELLKAIYRDVENK